MSLEVFTSKLSEVISTRKVEVFLPIAKQKVTISPMTIADDVNLRTRLTRLQEQLRAFLNVILLRSDFEKPYKDLKNFLSNITYFDAEVLAWGLYKATYGEFKDFNIFCEHCNHVVVRNVKPDELLHDDSLKLWEEDVDFTMYVHQMEVPLQNNLSLVINLQLPSMLKMVRILDSIPEQRAAQYLDLGISMTDYETLLMCIKSISLKEGNNVLGSVDTVQEIQMLLNTYIDVNVKDRVIEEYNKVFSEYTPKFYIEHKCPNCGRESKFEVISVLNLFFLRLVS